MTTTSLAPAVPAGIVQVIWVAVEVPVIGQLVPPTVTVVTPWKLVPVMVRVPPPAMGPDVGETLVIVGLL